MATIRHRKEWKADSEGRYSRQVGWQYNSAGNLVQHKFYLGTNLAEARSRNQRLEELWSHIVSQDTTTWSDLTLSWAKELAKGCRRIEMRRPANITPESYAKWLHRLQADFPMVPIVAEDQVAYDIGSQNAKQAAMAKIDTLVEMHQRSGALPVTPIIDGQGTLHQAFDAYKEWVKQDQQAPGQEEGQLKAWGYVQIRIIDRLKDKHKDIPLSGVDFDHIEQMVRLWRNRPLVKGKKKHITKDTADGTLAELRRFLKWLHRSKQAP